MIYLDNAATTFPKPESVYNEIMNCMKTYAANPGRGSHDMAVKAASAVMECRECIRAFFNMDSALSIIFTSNATEALNLGIKGILKKGDHVISSVTEHNSVLRPLSKLRAIGVQLTLLGIDELGYIKISELKSSIKKNTKLIIINHVSNVTGTIQKIKEIGNIAKQYNILFMVDASQSAGIVSIDVKRDNIDILATSGHKALYGPQGTGFLYIRKGIEIETLKEGGTGSNSTELNQPDFFPDRLECGTLNTPGIAGLNEGINFIKSIGRRNIHKKEDELTNYLIEELKKIPKVKFYGDGSKINRGSVVSINIEGYESSIVGELLNEKGICVRTGYHCAPLIHGIIGSYKYGTVRLSPGYFNTFAEMDTVINTIKELK